MGDRLGIPRVVDFFFGLCVVVYFPNLIIENDGKESGLYYIPFISRALSLFLYRYKFSNGTFTQTIIAKTHKQYLYTDIWYTVLYEVYNLLFFLIINIYVRPREITWQ